MADVDNPAMTASTGSGPPLLSPEEFVAALAQEFSITAEEIGPESRLVEELGFDSIDFYELLLFLEDRSGAFLNESVGEFLAVVADAYAVHAAVMTGRGGQFIWTPPSYH